MRLLIVLLFPVQLLFALTLTDNQTRYSHFSLPHLYDKDRQFTIQEIPAQKFQEGANQFTYGYQEGAQWFRLDMNNTSGQEEFILTFSDPLWKSFELYHYDGQTWRSDQAGLFTPLIERGIHNITPAFRLTIPKGESIRVYLRGESSSGQLGKVELFSAEEFYRPTRLHLHDLYLFFMLFLAIVLFFNLYLYWNRPVKLYLFYVLYIGALILWIAVKGGFYLRLDFPGWDEGLHTTGALLVALLTLFSREFLQLQERFIRLYKVFSGFVWVFFGFTVAIALDIPHTPLLFNITSSLFFTLLLFSSIKVWRDGHLEMRYYLIALMVYMPTMGMLTLTYNGFIDNHDITRYAFLFGSFAEVIFFNSLMISHYHIIFKDKIRMQNELLTLKEANESHLEKELKLRVNELEIANKKLTEQTKELEITQKQLEIEATTDALSTLYNRRYVLDVSGRLFDSAKRYNQPLSAVMIDIDDFKRINDTYGHAMGDEVIVHCANILKKITRSSDVLARYGGEEFLILLPNTPNDKVMELSSRINEVISTDRIPYGSQELIQYTVSLGITHLKEIDMSIDQLIQRADKALYRSKAKGKNCIEFL